METTPAFARPLAHRPTGLSWLAGFALLALAIYAAVALLQPIVAAIAGAGALALLRWARAERPYSRALIAIDAAAFAIFAYDRNDSLGFWQLPGPWADVFRFDPPGATIALIIYAGGSILARHRRLSGSAPHRGGEPDRDTVLVQPHACDRRRLAHGRTRRGGDGARQSALSGASRHWTRADPVVHRRGDLDSDQPDQRQSAAALGPHARCVCAERRGRGGHAFVRQCGAMGRSACPGDLFLRLVWGAGSGRLMGDRLSPDWRCSRLARRPPAALRGGLGTLADWLHQRRDLRRAVHGPNSHSGSHPERARRGGGS